jgi:hypothetical protein
MHREAPGIVEESRGIKFVDRDFCFAHVGDLFDVRCVIEMAMGENHRRYGIFIGHNCHGQYARVDEHVPDNIRVSIERSAGNPLDWHAQ